MRLFQKKQTGEQVELVIRGMSCDHCVMRVKKALTAVDGVQDADVSLEKGRATVTLSVTLDRSLSEQTAAMVAAVAEAGYEAERAQD
jgi:copper chaperone CopZ